MKGKNLNNEKTFRDRGSGFNYSNA